MRPGLFDRPVRPYVISNPAIRYPAVPALTVAQIRAHLLARRRAENGGGSSGSREVHVGMWVRGTDAPSPRAGNAQDPLIT